MLASGTRYKSSSAAISGSTSAQADAVIRRRVAKGGAPSRAGAAVMPAVRSIDPSWPRAPAQGLPDEAEAIVGL